MTAELTVHLGNKKQRRNLTRQTDFLPENNHGKAVATVFERCLSRLPVEETLLKETHLENQIKALETKQSASNSLIRLSTKGEKSHVKVGGKRAFITTRGADKRRSYGSFKRRSDVSFKRQMNFVELLLLVLYVQETVCIS